MSEENVEIIRTHFDLFIAGDIPAWLERFDPKAEWTTREDEPDAGVYRGHDGIRRLVDMWTDMFDELRPEPHEFIDAGDYVVVPSRLYGRGKGSGVEVDEPYTWVWKLDAGKIVEVREYRTKEEALEALGLEVREQGA